MGLPRSRVCELSQFMGRLRIGVIRGRDCCALGLRGRIERISVHRIDRSGASVAAVREHTILKERVFV